MGDAAPGKNYGGWAEPLWGLAMGCNGHGHRLPSPPQHPPPPRNVVKSLPRVVPRTLFEWVIGCPRLRRDLCPRSFFQGSSGPPERAVVLQSAPLSTPTSVNLMKCGGGGWWQPQSAPNRRMALLGRRERRHPCLGPVSTQECLRDLKSKGVEAQRCLRTTTLAWLQVGLAAARVGPASDRGMRPLPLLLLQGT